MSVVSYEMSVGSSGGAQDGPGEFVRGIASDGGVIVVPMTMDEWMDCRVPPRNQYRLRIQGFQVPFDQPNTFKGSVGQNGKIDERDTVTKTKIDFQIVKDDGTLGPHVLIWCGWPNSLTSNSNLGKLYFAATEGDDSAGGRVQVPDMIGRDVQAMLMPSTSLNNEGRPKYAQIAWDTLAPWDDSAPVEDPDLWR